MKPWENVRNLWLAIALVSSSLVVLRLALTPAQKPSLPTYTFPQSVPLSRWEFVKATPIGVQKLYTPSLATSVDDLTLSGQAYRYLRNGQPLEVEMRYFDRIAHVPDILRETTIRLDRIEFTPQRSELGAYAMYQRSDRLHLTACISAAGETTVERGELNSVQLRPTVLAGRIVPWFLGQAPLRDMRCLWTRISMPINPAAPQTTQQELEQAWGEWVNWWRKNYPPEP